MGKTCHLAHHLADTPLSWMQAMQSNGALLSNAIKAYYGVTKTGDELASVLSGPLLQVMRLYLQDPAGAPAAAHALDAPQSTGVEWATQGEKVAK
jgi:hypothetical protein